MGTAPVSSALAGTATRCIGSTAWGILDIKGTQEHRLARRKRMMLSQDDRMSDVAQLMSEEKMGLALVSDGKDSTNLMGVLSERDCLAALGEGASGVQVKRYMTGAEKIITVGPHTEFPDVLESMKSHRIRHLVVTGNHPKADEPAE